jgi:hypothetical protein
MVVGAEGRVARPPRVRGERREETRLVFLPHDAAVWGNRVAPAARPPGDLFGGGARSPRPRGIDLGARTLTEGRELEWELEEPEAAELEQDEGRAGSAAGGVLGASPTPAPNLGSRTHLDGGKGARVGGRARGRGRARERGWRGVAAGGDMVGRGEEEGRAAGRRHRRSKRGGRAGASGRGG